jgi:hypothetical protein
VTSRQHYLHPTYRLLLMFVLILTTVWPLASAPAPLGAAPPDEPPTPTSVASPTPQPPEPDVSSQAVAPPSPEDIPPEVEQARARHAMEAVLTKYLGYWTPSYQVASIEVAVESDWALGVAQWQGKRQVLIGPIHILAHRLPDGVWQALLPDSDGLYRQWVDALPGSLASVDEKARLHAQATEADALRHSQAVFGEPPAAALPASNREKPDKPPESVPEPAYSLAPQTGPGPLGPEQAHEAALSRMRTQVNLGQAPLWDGAALGDPIPLYDLSSEVTAYLFPVSQGTNSTGYLTVAALQLPNPVLEFTTEGPTPLSGALDLAKQKGLQVAAPQRPLYLGLLNYGYELIGPSTGQRLVLDLLTGATLRISEEEARIPLRQRIRTDTVQPQDQPIQIMAYSLISGVPDWNQFWGSYGCWSGCSPTATTNMMGYWDNQGYGNLINGSDWQGAVDEMRSRMGTECMPDGSGGTYISNISPGINSYAQAHGYNFASELWCSECSTGPTYDRYRSEIDGNRPLVVDVIGHSTYHDHSVAGVGYETNGSYMIVHDNWSSTGENVYLQYGSGYSSIYMHPVVPGGGTSCPQSGGIILYRHANYDCGGQGENVGYMQRTAPGDYDIGSLGINDQPSSIHVPSGWSVRLYRDGGFSGPSACLNRDDSDFADNSYDGGGILNDSVSSFRVYSSLNCGDASGEGVNLCRSTGYSNCMLFTNDAPSLGNAGFGNDDAESIQMLGDWSAVLFVDDNYQGTHSVFNGSDSNLGDNSIGNNQASSMRVRKRSPANFTLFDLGDWNGASFPSDRTIHDLGHWDFNDRAESIRVASGYQVIVCEHSDFHGVCGRTTQDAGDLNSLAQGLRNAASSVRVCAGSCPPTPNAPSLSSPVNGAAFSPGSLVTFQWSGNGDQYYVELWGGSLGSTQTSGWIDGLQWSKSGLPTSSSPYYWHVKAWNGYGESGWSSTWSFTISGAPAAPSNLVATAASREQINLSWTDNSSNETGFKIYRDGAYIAQVGVGVTAYQDTGRQCNTTYSYTVRATNAAGDSAASNQASATTHACPSPVDLVPTQLSGWAYPIIPSSTTGTYQVSELYTDRPTHLDWGVTNRSGTDSSGDVYGEVYIDSTLLASYNFGQVRAYEAWYFSDWPSWTQSVSGWHTLKVVADPDNLITEADESNNSWEGQFYWQPTCNDAYEDNDTYTSATALAPGQTRNADICGPGDYDYYRFTGTAGQRIVVDIDAQVNGSLLDSYVSLIDSDGLTILAEHDDEVVGVRRDAHLGYELPHSGTYYIRVRAWEHPDAGGPDYFYNVTLLQDNTLPSGEITSPSTDAWLNPTLETVVATTSDGQSGISHVDFLWHDADWSSSDWIWLGSDWDGSDGWSRDFDTSGQPEQDGGAFYIWAFDWAGNQVGDGTWQLGIDRTPPSVGADISPLYGDAPFLDFYVWWYGSDNLSGIASYDVQYRDGPGGAWTNLLNGTTDTRTRFVGQDEHTYYFRARARDEARNLGTYASGDGDAQRMVNICATSADAREPDNSYTEARTIATDGSWQSHNFHAAGDQDWLKFTATAGVTYTLVTANTGGHADTMLSLYAPNGTTLLAFNDDDPDNWPASLLEWGVTSHGTYYVKIEHWDPHAYGCTAAYDVSIAETGTFEISNRVFLPIILKNAPY